MLAILLPALVPEVVSKGKEEQEVVFVAVAARVESSDYADAFSPVDFGGRALEPLLEVLREGKVGLGDVLAIQAQLCDDLVSPVDIVVSIHERRRGGDLSSLFFSVAG